MPPSTTGKTYGRWTQDQKAEAIVRCQSGDTISRVARDLRIPRQTVAGWVSGTEKQSEEERARSGDRAAPLAVRQKKEQEMLEKWREVTSLSLGVLRTKLGDGEGNVQQLGMIAGIGFDKIRLLQNQPTAITAVEDLASLLSEAGYTKPHALEDIKKTA